MSYRVLLPSNIAAIIFLVFGQLGSNLSYFNIDVMPLDFQGNFNVFKWCILRDIGLSIYTKELVYMSDLYFRLDAVFDSVYVLGLSALCGFLDLVNELFRCGILSVRSCLVLCWINTNLYPAI